MMVRELRRLIEYIDPDVEVMATTAGVVTPIVKATIAPVGTQSPTDPVVILAIGQGTDFLAKGVL
jgi:hypothetical protein